MAATGGERYEHLLSSRARRGPRPNWGTSEPRYRFAGGFPDPSSLPYHHLVQATADVMELDGADALTYGPPYGYDGLRDFVVHKYRALEGLEIGRDNVLITNGSNDAIAMVVAAVVDEGDAVICEIPTFMATLGLLQRYGVDLIGVEMDRDGMRTDQLADRLADLKAAGRRCKLIYTVDTFHNPAGTTMSERRRRELVALAAEHQVMVLEDDAYGELRFEGQAPPSLYSLDDSGLVCRTGTLSKILAAGVRLGWVVAPASLLPYLAAFNFGGGVAPLTSRVCALYLREHLMSHVKELVDIYRAKRDAMLEELERGLGDSGASWSRPEGGFFIWLKLPDRTDPVKLSRLAAEAGVAYTPGTACMPAGGERFIRLAYSFESPEDIREGTRLLCGAIKGAVPAVPRR